MSKIGKINISIPEKVKVVLSGNLINIEGPLGKKTLNIDVDMFDLKIDEGKSVSIKLNKMMPFFNEISAGNPLEILNEDVKYINYSDLFKNTKGNSFACKVNGNSMEEFGIFNGDTVIVNRDITFSSKSIYAIQIDNTEVTLKKINILNSEIEIFGDSKNFHTKKYKKDRIKIIGKMVSLIRSYK